MDPMGWNLKITQFEKNNHLPNLHCWVPAVNFPGCKIEMRGEVFFRSQKIFGSHEIMFFFQMRRMGLKFIYLLINLPYRFVRQM